MKNFPLAPILHAARDRPMLRVMLQPYHNEDMDDALIKEVIGSQDAIVDPAHRKEAFIYHATSCAHVFPKERVSAFYAQDGRGVPHVWFDLDAKHGMVDSVDSAESYRIQPPPLRLIIHRHLGDQSAPMATLELDFFQQLDDGMDADVVIKLVLCIQGGACRVDEVTPLVFRIRPSAGCETPLLGIILGHQAFLIDRGLNATPHRCLLHHP